MALEITKDTPAAGYTSPERLYLTIDDRVVKEGDPDANTLLVAEGGVLSQELADKYGLGAKAKKAKAEPEADAEPDAEPEHHKGKKK